MFVTLTKHVNNQANCCITLEKLKKNMDLSSLIHLAVTKVDSIIYMAYRIRQARPS